MIIIMNRELLIPDNEQTIGTTQDHKSENRLFRLNRFAQNGVDLSELTYRLDLRYPHKRTVYTFETSTSRTGGAAVILTKPFMAKYTEIGTYTFTFNGTVWNDGTEDVELDKIGVVISFTPTAGDSVTVTSSTYETEADTVLLEKDITDDYINLTWNITDAQLAVPGTVLASIRGSDSYGTVRFGSFQAAFYVEVNLFNGILYPNNLSELEQLENLVADGLGKIEYLYTKYLDLKKASEDAEAWAVGTREGVPVEPDDETYQNNSKYYNDLAEQHEADSHEFMELSEAWAKGTRGGVPVESGEPGYKDNSKYWAEQSESFVGQAEYWSEIAHDYASSVSYKKIYANVPAMVADTDIEDGQVVRTLGYWEANDGGGALYRVRQPKASDDYSSTADSSTSARGLVRLVAEYDNNPLLAELMEPVIRVEMFGAKGDGVSDDAERLITALRYTSVLYCFKNYKINKRISLIGGKSVYFYGNVDMSDTIYVLGHFNTLYCKGTINVPANSCGIEFIGDSSYNKIVCSKIVAGENSVGIRFNAITGGVSHNDIDIQNIVAGRIGIEIISNDVGYANENTFRKSNIRAETGIYMRAYAQNSINGNCFEYTDCEGCTTAIWLANNCRNNRFIALRTMEFGLDPKIKIGGSIIHNEFEGMFRSVNFVSDGADIVDTNLIRGKLLSASGFVIWAGVLAFRNEGHEVVIYPLSEQKRARYSLSGDITLDLAAETALNYHQYNMFTSGPSIEQTAPVITLSRSYGYRKIDKLYLKHAPGRPTPVVKDHYGDVVYKESEIPNNYDTIEIVWIADGQTTFSTIPMSRESKGSYRVNLAANETLKISDFPGAVKLVLLTRGNTSNALYTQYGSVELALLTGSVSAQDVTISGDTITSVRGSLRVIVIYGTAEG